MNKTAIDLLLRNHPELATKRDQLESMQPGAIVFHRGWGLGRIKEYDESTAKIVIVFETDNTVNQLDPAFFIDKLEVLPANSIVTRHRNNPEEIEEMLKKHPTDLIVNLLDSLPDKMASTTEIEKQLNRALGDKRYKKWWTATKKLLVKDPRIALPIRKTDPYVLRDMPVKPEDEILHDFLDTKAPKKKIALADRLLALSVKHEDIKESLPDILQSLAICLKETRQLNAGERLHGIWVRNDLARFIHEDPELLEPTSASLLRETLNLSELADLIPSAYYKRFLNLIERTFVDEWQKIHFDLLRNSSGKFTTEVINYLMEKGLQNEIRDRLQRWLNEQNLKGPLLYWIIKNRHSRKYMKLVEKLLNTRFFAAVFYAIDHEALQNASSRRILLADLLVEDTELVSELLSESTPETAHDLATTLMLNQGFEDLSKKSLMARFIKRFPNIQSLVDGGDSAVNKRETLLVSKESFELRKSEYEDLVSKRIPANKEAIATAREHGDLRENAEYKMARQEQDTLLARKNQLEVDLSRAQITDFLDAPTDVIGIGSLVTLKQGSTGKSVIFSVLGAWDSVPEKNILSYETPLARNLIAKKIGDSVKLDINGHEEVWTVQQIERVYEKALKS
jgi:transcription elongation GreA/GreB family factor/transcription elongation factor GreA-like protein